MSNENDIRTALCAEGIDAASVHAVLQPLLGNGGVLTLTQADAVSVALAHHSGRELEVRMALLEYLHGEELLRFFYAPEGVRPGEVEAVLETMLRPEWRGGDVPYVLGSIYRYTESFAGRFWLERQIGAIWEPEWPSTVRELATYAVTRCPASWWAGNSEHSLTSNGSETAGPFQAALTAVLAGLDREALEVLDVLAAESEELLPRLAAAAAELSRPKR